MRRQFTAPLLRPVLDFAEIWFRDFFPSITFHDPLIAATIFAPHLCGYEWGTITVDLSERPGVKPGLVITIFFSSQDLLRHRQAGRVQTAASDDHVA